MEQKRSISEHRWKWLAQEMKSWREERILSAQQINQIGQFYESSTDRSLRQSSRSLFILKSMSAILIGLAVFLVIGHNWKQLPDTAKLIMIFASVTGSHVLGFYIRFQKNSKTLSEVAFFFGCLLYGAGIFLIAQIFHLNAQNPNEIWFWALGVLPFALCLRTPLCHLLYISLLTLWCSIEIFEFGSAGTWHFWNLVYLPKAAYTLPLMVLPGLAWAYNKRSLVIAGLYIALTSWWLCLQPIAWEASNVSIYFMGAVGALLLIVAECHSRENRFSIPYRICGILILGGVLIPLSFYDYYNFRTYIYDNTFTSHYYVSFAIIVLAGLTVGALFLLRNRISPNPIRSDNLLPLMKEQWFLLAVLFSMMVLPSITALTKQVWSSTIAANAIMLGLSIWLIRCGLQTDRGLPFIAGILYFLLWAVLRYFDLFGNFAGFLGGAVVLTFCGLALYLVSLYWVRRRVKQHE